MDCTGFRARHLDYVDGTLDEPALVACERHRAECAECARLDIRVRRGLLVCHNVARGAQPCDLTARVLAGVRADRRRIERQSAWRRAAAGWVTVCAACAVTVVSVNRWMARPDAAARTIATAPATPPLAAVPTAPVTASEPPADSATPVVATAMAMVVPVSPSGRSLPRRVPVLGPLDSALEILGDTFPAAPLGRPGAPQRRTGSAGFVTVSFPAP